MTSLLLPLVMLAGTNLPSHNLLHEETFGKQTNEINRAVLGAIDRIQATAPEGGGYFASVKAMPSESPIGFGVTLFGVPLLAPSRTTSYCSGASYSALVGALDTILKERSAELTPERLEAVRMQEPDGSRREDLVKLWGWWNADGPGTLYALSKFTRMGSLMGALEVEPGDFCNINWGKGAGHSVIFLGWEPTGTGEPAMRYWSSQKGTNGLGDQTSLLSTMSGLVFIRLTHPEALFELDPARKMEKVKIEYDSALVVAERLKQRGGLGSKTGGQ